MCEKPIAFFIAKDLDCVATCMRCFAKAGYQCLWLDIDEWIADRSRLKRASLVVLDEVDPKFQMRPEVMALEFWLMFETTEPQVLVLSRPDDRHVRRTLHGDARVAVHFTDEPFSVDFVTMFRRHRHNREYCEVTPV